MAKLARGGITTVVTPVAAMGETGMEAWLSLDDSGLRHGDGVADAAEGVVAAIAAGGGDDEVVFAAGDWVVERVNQACSGASRTIFDGECRLLRSQPHPLTARTLDGYRGLPSRMQTPSFSFLRLA